MAKSVAFPDEVVTSSAILFGEPPLLDGENSAAYHDLHSKVSDAVNPTDVLEKIWVRDVVDLTWEVFRLRGYKTRLITANMHRGMNAILDPLCGYKEAAEISAGWALQEKDAVKQVNGLLADARLTMDEVRSETLALKISDIERIDRLIMNSEARRNAALREIERHRTALGQTLRRATADVVDGEFETIPPQISGKTLS